MIRASCLGPTSDAALFVHQPHPFGQFWIDLDRIGNRHHAFAGDDFMAQGTPIDSVEEQTAAGL